MVRYSRGIEQRKQFFNCKANMVWRGVAIMNGQIIYVANRLHGKAAELCLE